MHFLTTLHSNTHHFTPEGGILLCCSSFLISIFDVLTANSRLLQLFEGEPAHLVPSASHFLVESDMFMVAGRMIGHSFLHGGPRLQGSSPAVTHVLLGESPEMATLTLENCPNLDK